MKHYRKKSWHQYHKDWHRKRSEIQPVNWMLQKSETVQRWDDFRGSFRGDYSSCLFWMTTSELLSDCLNHTTYAEMVLDLV